MVDFSWFLRINALSIIDVAIGIVIILILWYLLRLIFFGTKAPKLFGGDGSSGGRGGSGDGGSGRTPSTPSTPPGPSPTPPTPSPPRPPKQKPLRSVIFRPSGGNLFHKKSEHDVDVTISPTVFVAGAQIFYTLDGSEPSANPANQYAAPVHLSLGKHVIKAKYIFGARESKTATAKYDIVAPKEPKAGTPTIIPASGSYPSGKIILINTNSPAPPAATIYYTTDGSDPTLNPTQAYTPGTDIPLTHDITIKARSYAPGYRPSNIVTEKYKVIVPSGPQVPDPKIYPLKRNHTAPINVRIKCSDSSATIYYAIDAVPVVGDPSTIQYTSPLNLINSATVQAVAVRPGFKDSNIVSATFNISTGGGGSGSGGGIKSVDELLAELRALLDQNQLLLPQLRDAMNEALLINEVIHIRGTKTQFKQRAIVVNRLNHQLNTINTNILKVIHQITHHPQPLSSRQQTNLDNYSIEFAHDTIYKSNLIVDYDDYLQHRNRGPEIYTYKMKQAGKRNNDGSTALGAAALIGVIESSIPGPYYLNLFSSLAVVLKRSPLSPEDWLSFKEALERKRKMLQKEKGLQNEILDLIQLLVKQEGLFQFDASKGFFWNQAESHNVRKLEELRKELVKVRTLQERWQKEESISTPYLLSINQWLIAASIVLGKENKPASVEYFYYLIKKVHSDSSLVPLLSDATKIIQFNASIKDLMILGRRVLGFKVTGASLQSSSELQLQLKWLDNALAWVDQLPHHRAGVSTRIRFAFG